MKSINNIFRDIVSSTSGIYGKNISYMFGDWDYIAGILTEWAESPKMSKLRFPIICLYSPYTEDRTGRDRTTTLELAIMVDTLKDYTNEEREKVSFEGRFVLFMMRLLKVSISLLTWCMSIIIAFLITTKRITATEEKG